jgi:beta-glucosidase
LFLDDKKLLDETRNAAGGHRTSSATVHLDAGTAYRIRAEYVQRGGGGGVELVWTPPAGTLLTEAVNTTKNSDLTILCLGLNSRLEGEESPIQIPGFEHGDRTALGLPEPQEKLLEAVLDTGKPIIVVLLNGSALTVNAAKQRAGAILETWYGGQEGGAAIARTLSGENNPAGRLPVTFYESVNQLPPFSDYAMKNRTYRYFTGQALYPFGYGLSYSVFRYSHIKMNALADGQFEITARVKNDSRRAGDEVTQLYVTAPNEKPELKAFIRTHFAGGQSRSVRFLLNGVGLKGGMVTLGGGQPHDGQSISVVLPKS